MSFKEWIFSDYENPRIDGQWGWLYITTLVVCIALIVGISLLLRKKSLKAKRIVLWVLVGLILLFEIARRIINFCKATGPLSAHDVLHILLPRPWCAISCWSLIIATIFNKKFLYNFASVTALLCALIFFAYPGVGFNNKYILFENLYSIGTHSLLLIVSILMITLKFAQFEYKNIWKESICFVVILLYAILEIYVFKIESDPMYFMPNNDIQDILGVSYGAFLPLYILFVFIYFNIFYLIGDRKNLCLKNKTMSL